LAEGKLLEGGLLKGEKITVEGKIAEGKRIAEGELLKGNCQRELLKRVDKIGWQQWLLLIVCKSEGRDFKKAKERTWDSASLSIEALRESVQVWGQRL
jgi:hypothetical protein